MNNDIFNLASALISDICKGANMPFVFIAETEEGHIAVASNMSLEGVGAMIAEVKDQHDSGEMDRADKHVVPQPEEAAASLNSGNKEQTDV